MSDIKKNTTILLLLLLAGNLVQGAPKYQQDSSKQYPWLNRDQAIIEFHDSSAFLPFYHKVRNDSRIVIAHLGDSHVQPDISTAVLRNFFRGIKGDAGRGFIFPFASARTHSGFDYHTRTGGYWQSARNTDNIPKLPLGVSGVTVRTSDANAWFSVSFRNEVPDHYRRLRIFCRRNKESFNLQLTAGLDVIRIPVADSLDAPIEVILPVAQKSFTIRMSKTEQDQKEFEIYGMSLESTGDEGSMVHALGLAGAPYRSILLESLFDQQARELAPDLVILDYGTNDYIPGNRIPADMKIRIIDVIRKVRNALPETTIVLTSTQDMNRRGLQMTAGRPFSKMMRQIAEEEHCGFFDWYWISGGPGSMKEWVRNGLAQRDNIHLTAAGYRLKGELLAQSFRNTFTKLSEEPGISSLAFEGDSISLPQLMARDNNRVVPAAPSGYRRDQLPNGELFYHRIRPGETLGSIADRYQVSIRSLQELNGLSGTRIYAGKSLKVIIRQPKSQTATIADSKPEKSPAGKPNASIPGKTSETGNRRTISHRIESGETLTSIAEKYEVSVEQLKKTNKLQTNRIEAGKTLLIELPVTTDRKNKS